MNSLISVASPMLANYLTGSGGASFLAWKTFITGLMLAFLSWMIISGVREWTTGEVTAFGLVFIVVRVAMVASFGGYVLITMLSGAAV